MDSVIDSWTWSLVWFGLNDHIFRQELSLRCEDRKIDLWDTNKDDVFPNKDEFCVDETKILMMILIPICVLIVVIAVSIVLYITNKEIITIWVYAQPWGKRLFSEDLIDKEKPYDAFISYSQVKTLIQKQSDRSKIY